MAKSQDGIRVEIYDQDYNIKGELDSNYIQKLAKFVDWKMRTVAAQTHTVDSLRVAVLAALNIADEYHQLKTKVGWRSQPSRAPGRHPADSSPPGQTFKRPS